jgi:hypothetical protein
MASGRLFPVGRFSQAMVAVPDVKVCRLLVPCKIPRHLGDNGGGCHADDFPKKKGVRTTNRTPNLRSPTKPQFPHYLFLSLPE